MHAHVIYLNLSCVVGYDESQQDDCGQADQTLQCQRVHGALQRENKDNNKNKKINTDTQLMHLLWSSVYS